MAAKRLVLCDSVILMNYLRGDEDIKAELDELGFDRITTSDVVIMEIYRGMKKAEMADTKILLNKINRFPLTSAISKRAVALVWEYYDWHPGLGDVLIGATALENNLEVFTLNKKHFLYYKKLKFYKPKRSF